MASLMGRVLDRLPSPAERAQRIEELIALIQQRVADARLHVKPCLTVAEAICDGWYPLAQLLRVFEVLDRMDAAGRVQQRWSYFVGAARRSMREHDSREK